MGHGWTGGGSPLLQNGILSRRSVLVAQWARSDGAVGVGPRAGCGARLATGDLSAGDSLRERRGAAARLGLGASRCNDSDNGSDSGANGDSHSGRRDAVPASAAASGGPRSGPCLTSMWRGGRGRGKGYISWIENNLIYIYIYIYTHTHTYSPAAVRESRTVDHGRLERRPEPGSESGGGPDRTRADESAGRAQAGRA